MPRWFKPTELYDGIIDEHTPDDVYFKPQPPFDLYSLGHTRSTDRANGRYKLVQLVAAPKAIPRSLYMMCVSIGRHLADNEVIVFIDGNGCNCTLSNLKIEIIPGSYAEPLKENPENRTRFKPEPPYTKYKCGTVGIHSDGRKHVSLTGGPYSSRTGFPVARYLKIVDHFKKTGVVIDDPTIHAHHINEDRTDDRLENLEWRKGPEHNRQHFNGILEKKIVQKVLVCPVCKTLFEKQLFSDTLNIPICCSFSCYSFFSKQFQPYVEHAKLLRSMAEQQELFVYTDQNLLNFNLGPQT